MLLVAKKNPFVTNRVPCFATAAENILSWFECVRYYLLWLFGGCIFLFLIGLFYLIPVLCCTYLIYIVMIYDFEQ